MFQTHELGQILTIHTKVQHLNACSIVECVTKLNHGFTITPFSCILDITIHDTLIMFLVVNFFKLGLKNNSDGSLNKVISRMSATKCDHVGITIGTVQYEYGKKIPTMMPCDLSVWNGRPNSSLGASALEHNDSEINRHIFQSFFLPIKEEHIKIIFSEMLQENESNFPLDVEYPSIFQMIMDYLYASMNISHDFETSRNLIIERKKPLQCAQYVIFILERYFHRNTSPSDARNEILFKLKQLGGRGCSLHPGDVCDFLLQITEQKDDMGPSLQPQNGVIQTPRDVQKCQIPFNMFGNNLLRLNKNDIVNGGPLGSLCLMTPYFCDFPFLSQIRHYTPTEAAYGVNGVPPHFQSKDQFLSGISNPI